jgi:hypothetical protein
MVSYILNPSIHRRLQLRWKHNKKEEFGVDTRTLYNDFKLSLHTNVLKVLRFSDILA